MGQLPKVSDVITPLGLGAFQSRGRYQRAAHLEYLQNEVMAVLFGDWDILVASAPPRHGKSEFLSRWFPTWYHSVYPADPSMVTSYSIELARKHSRWVRDKVHTVAPWFGLQGVDPNVAAAGDWSLMGFADSGMKAAGVGGGITGRGAKIAIIDDNLKNADQALSERVRESQWEWFQTTLMTRIEPGGRILALATRWHEDDLIGKILKYAESDLGLKVRECRLPALSLGDGDPLGRPLDAPLWPSRWPYESLCRRRDSMEPYWWMALYQQVLTTYGRNEWPASYTANLMWPEEDWPKSFVLHTVALDPSVGKKEDAGDYSAICHAGFKGGYIWLDFDLDRRPAPQMMADLVAFVAARRPTLVGIEDVAFQHLLGESYVLACEEANVSLDDPVMVSQTVSKELRIRKLGFWLRIHRIRIKDNQSGRLVLKQLREFPNCDHDDGPDAAELAIRLLLQLSEELSSVASTDYQSEHLGV